jgi:hypothetical protein
MPFHCLPKFELLDFVPTLRVGPDRLPLGALVAARDDADWVAYWYRTHDSCMADRCPCWAAVRQGHGAKWHGDGIAIVATSRAVGRATTAVVHSLLHGAQDVLDLRPQSVSALATVKVLAADPCAARDRATALQAILSCLPGLDADACMRIGQAYVHVWDACEAAASLPDPLPPRAPLAERRAAVDAR